MTTGQNDIDPQKAAAQAALAEWADAWAAHRGTGEAHAEVIRAWAAPTRPDAPAAPPPDADTTDRQERIWAWGTRVTGAQGRVKERRGLTVYQQLPGGGQTRHCGRDGCPCTHGRYRNQNPGDVCDRGFIPAPGGPSGAEQVARCPTCRYHAETAKATPA